MTHRSDEANEADILEQEQDLDGTGPETSAPDVRLDEADPADALEQGSHIDTSDEDAYPREGDEPDV